MDVDEVASLITPRTKLLITNSPHNPTGSILTDADTRRLAELAVEHDLVVLADEIYARLQYSGEPLSIATLPGMAERTITLDGFSKTFAMTGWRLGYGIIPEWLAPAFSRLVINSVSLHERLRPARRGRGLDRPTGCGRCDARRVPRSPAADGGRSERDSRRDVRDAARSVLHLPERLVVRANEQRDRRPPPLRRRRVRPLGDRLRRPRRGTPALQLCELAREPGRRARPHRRLPGQARTNRELVGAA